MLKMAVRFRDVTNNSRDDFELEERTKDTKALQNISVTRIVDNLVTMDTHKNKVKGSNKQSPVIAAVGSLQNTR